MRGEFSTHLNCSASPCQSSHQSAVLIQMVALKEDISWNVLESSVENMYLAFCYILVNENPQQRVSSILYLGCSYL